VSQATVQVEGARQLRSALRRAEGNLDDLKAAHAAVSLYVAQQAAARAPRRTGRLAATVRGTRQATRARVSAGRASVPYAGPIHWGWPSRGIAPQPFIADTARSTETVWVQMYRTEVDRILARIRP
jgi:hypothetical protein